MSGLPAKPEAVAHVSDAHWEFALRKADSTKDDIIELARCLILLGEANEPADPIEDGLKKAFHAWLTDKRYFDDAEKAFNAACLKHFAGLTFPEVQP